MQVCELITMLKNCDQESTVMPYTVYCKDEMDGTSNQIELYGKIESVEPHSQDDSVTWILFEY